MRPMSKVAHRVVGHLVAGGCLLGRRQFPFPMKWMLTDRLYQATEHAEGTAIEEGSVINIVKRGFLQPKPEGPIGTAVRWDVINYLLTDEGRLAYEQDPQTLQTAERG